MTHAPLTIGQLSQIVAGRLVRAADVDPTMPVEGRHVIDSRSVAAGDVFWALRGAHADGADFAADAFRRGAAGVIASRWLPPSEGGWAIQVDDPQQALWRLAAWRRRTFAGCVIGVTGSVGKTTTRHMIDTALRSTMQGRSSPRNYNNHLGLPLSLLSLDEADQYAVLELGASASGEIRRLARLCCPRIAVITQIGEAHLEGFGDLDGVLRAKAEILEPLQAGDWAVVNGDDPRLRRLAAELRGPRVVRFGRRGDCQVVPDEVRCRPGSLLFKVDGVPFTLPVWGRHHLPGALAAIAVGRVLGLPLRVMAEALKNYTPPPMRCQVLSVRGITLINDAYNANPTSMRAALELLRDLPATGRRIAVLGDMSQLGRHAAALHRRVGSEVVTVCGAEVLIACGGQAEEIAAGACQAGMPARRIVACATLQQAEAALRGALAAGDMVLVKGSRAMQMERLVERLETDHDHETFLAATAAPAAAESS